MVQHKQGEFGERPMGQSRAEPASVREGVETMHPAPQRIGDEEIVRTARIDEGADGGRNDRRVMVAWAAGFFDGEGCISISSNSAGRGSRSLVLRLSVAQLDQRPLDILRTLFGGSVNRYAPAPPRRADSQWVATSRLAYAALYDMLPYLRVKGEQAVLAMEFQRMKATRPTGIRLTDDEASTQSGFRDTLKAMHWKP